jgi:alpha-galactosidase
VNEHGTAYVLLGAGAEFRFSNKELKAYVDDCHRNGLKAGSYFCPFKIGGAPDKDLSKPANGSGYTWLDLVLKDHAGNPIIDQTKYALDPTHPGTRKMIKDKMTKYHALGIDWLRMDFMDIGALEGAHFQQGVTGMQAYREGMEYIAQLNDGRMHLNLAISPVFPSQFAHSRRISNDVNDTVKETEYQLNSLAYGWWLDRLYSHNDPGNVAFDPEGDPAVAKMRMQAAVICSGQIVVVNDWSGEEGRRVSNPWISNARIMELARKRPAFYPIEGHTGGAAPSTLVWRDGSDFYIALFNYSPEAFETRLDLGRAGLTAGARYKAIELWSGQQQQLRNTASWKLKGYECRLYRLKEQR